jgi:small subunit ribosomal protein S17
MSEEQTKQRGRRHTLVGTVTSDKMDKTVVVRVDTTVMHPLYQRYVRRSTKYTAHDEKNLCGEGDMVSIVASRPLSKTKRWRVGEIMKRAV